MPSYPEELADRAWDNVGLLLGNIDSNGQKTLGLDATPEHKTVLLTNDLSSSVAQEAVDRKASVIVSYRTLHSLTHSLTHAEAIWQAYPGLLSSSLMQDD